MKTTISAIISSILKIPMEQVIEEKNGKRKVVERKLLPCYVFIKMIYTNQIWYYVTSTRGVTGFCGPQGRPIPMKEEEIRKMRLEEFVSDVDFKVGDTVSIEEGPLKGFLGTVKELNNAAQKAKISTSMFGRNTDVEVEYLQIKRVDAALPETRRGIGNLNFFRGGYYFINYASESGTKPFRFGNKWERYQIFRGYLANTTTGGFYLWLKRLLRS